MANNDPLQFTQWHCLHREMVRLKKKLHNSKLHHCFIIKRTTNKMKDICSQGSQVPNHHVRNPPSQKWPSSFPFFPCFYPPCIMALGSVYLLQGWRPSCSEFAHCFGISHRKKCCFEPVYLKEASWFYAALEFSPNTWSRTHANSHLSFFKIWSLDVPINWLGKWPRALLTLTCPFLKIWSLEGLYSCLTPVSPRSPYTVR